jgi:hypothetical protein
VDEEAGVECTSESSAQLSQALAIGLGILGHDYFTVALRIAWCYRILMHAVTDASQWGRICHAHGLGKWSARAVMVRKVELERYPISASSLRER